MTSTASAPQVFRETTANGNVTIEVSKNINGGIALELSLHDAIGWYALTSSDEEPQVFHETEEDANNDVISAEHDEPHSLYVSADTEEGQPNPLLEALRHIPALLTKITGEEPEPMVPASKIEEIIRGLRDDDEDVYQALTALISPQSEG